MRFGWENSLTGKFAIWERTEYPSESVSFPRELRLDLVLTGMNKSIALLGGLLIFSEDIARQRVSWPQAPLEFDDSVRRVWGELAPRFEIDQNPGWTPDNHTVLILCDNRPYAVPIQSIEKPRQVLLQVRDSAYWTGKMFSIDRVEFAANISAFGTRFAEDLSFRVAIALLLCGDWRSSELVVERPKTSSSSSSSTGVDEGDLIDLCASIGIKLRVLDTAQLEEMLVYAK